MFGGGGMNPRKLQQMMEQMGIEVAEIDATEVRITTAEGDALVFDAPDVTRMDAQGQQTYQIVGEPETEPAGETAGAAGEAADPAIPDSDIALVTERTGANPEEAREALAASDGDLAQAIDRLS